MKANEILNALVSAGMRISEVEAWLKFQNGSSVKSLFPIVYKNGTSFEVLPELIPSRKDEVWGYEIMPGIFLAKKCGSDGNVGSTTWDNCKAFAEKMSLDGKLGSLPSKEVLKQNWSEELRGKIKTMDVYLCVNGVDGEQKYYGICFCSEVDHDDSAYCFGMGSGNGDWDNKTNIFNGGRLAVAF